MFDVDIVSTAEQHKAAGTDNQQPTILGNQALSKDKDIGKMARQMITTRRGSKGKQLSTVDLKTFYGHKRVLADVSNKLQVSKKAKSLSIQVEIATQPHHQQ